MPWQDAPPPSFSPEVSQIPVSLAKPEIARRQGGSQEVVGEIEADRPGFELGEKMVAEKRPENRRGQFDRRHFTLYISPMIGTFRHKSLEAFYRTGSKAGVQPAHAAKLRVLL